MCSSRLLMTKTILSSSCNAFQTCCDGVLYNNIAGYVCCGRHYLPSPSPPPSPGSPSAPVCCGVDNHECCGERYVQVLPGETCCPDPDQNRVDIGPGDKCCGSVPYSSDGPQTCCNGEPLILTALLL